MADPLSPPPSGPPWSNLLYLLAIAAFGWFGDWLRSRWQRRAEPRGPEHEHRRHDDPPCEECHHHHRDEDDEHEE